MKKIFALLLAVLLTPLMARCPDPVGPKPLWANNLPKDTEFSYFRAVYAEAPTLEEVRRQAKGEVFRGQGTRTGEQVKILDTEEFGSFKSDNDLEVKYDVVCEHHYRRSDGMYNYWVLVQIARNPTYPLPQVPPEYFRNLESKDAVGLKPFIPGAAQIYKGSNVKGALFIVSEIALIGGIVTTEVLRSSAASKMKTTQNATQWKSHRDKADNMQNARNILIAGAGAIYVWNIIDGFVAKGPSAGLELTFNF